MPEFVESVLAFLAADSIGALLQAFILVSGLAGQYFIANRNAFGFKVWIASNLALIWVSATQGLFGMVALYIVYTFMCIYSVRKWSATGHAA